MWFETKPRPFVLPARLRCHSEPVGALLVSERRLRNAAGPYGIRLEGYAQSLQDLESVRAEAFRLADELDEMWAYVAGVPLFPTVRTVSLAQAPYGWVGNFQRIKAHVSAGRPRLTRERLVQKYLVTLPYLPLKPALQAVRAFRDADDVTRFLVSLHNASLRDTTGSGSMVFLAKALEVVRAILPGSTDRAKERHLPSEVRTKLRRSLHWLYGIANQRVEVRHVVRDPARLEFHPKLTIDERRDYQSQGELVVRGVIAERLKIVLVTRSST